jgi:hypothetical protein
LVFINTHANGDAERDNLAPDISVYAVDNVPDADVKTDFSRMELFVELKLAETSDPFRDPKDPRRPQSDNFRFENGSEVSQLNRGQLCSYAAAHAGSQFRVHTFTVYICGKSARFIRWDRSGATVHRMFTIFPPRAGRSRMNYTTGIFAVEVTFSIPLPFALKYRDTMVHYPRTVGR